MFTPAAGSGVLLAFSSGRDPQGLRAPRKVTPRLSRRSRVRLFTTRWAGAARLPCAWGSPGENTGVCCRARLQAISPARGWSPCRLRLLPRPASSPALAPPEKPLLSRASVPVSGFRQNLGLDSNSVTCQPGEIRGAPPEVAVVVCRKAPGASCALGAHAGSGLTHRGTADGRAEPSQLPEGGCHRDARPRPGVLGRAPSRSRPGWGPGGASGAPFRSRPASWHRGVRGHGRCS